MIEIAWSEAKKMDASVDSGILDFIKCILLQEPQSKSHNKGRK